MPYYILRVVASRQKLSLPDGVYVRMLVTTSHFTYHVLFYLTLTVGA